MGAPPTPTATHLWATASLTRRPYGYGAEFLLHGLPAIAVARYLPSPRDVMQVRIWYTALRDNPSLDSPDFPKPPFCTLDGEGELAHADGAFSGLLAGSFPYVARILRGAERSVVLELWSEPPLSIADPVAHEAFVDRVGGRFLRSG